MNFGDVRAAGAALIVRTRARLLQCCANKKSLTAAVTCGDVMARVYDRVLWRVRRPAHAAGD